MTCLNQTTNVATLIVGLGGYFSGINGMLQDSHNGGVTPTIGLMLTSLFFGILYGIFSATSHHQPYRFSGNDHSLTKAASMTGITMWGVMQWLNYDFNPLYFIMAVLPAALATGAIYAKCRGNNEDPSEHADIESNTANCCCI